MENPKLKILKRLSNHMANGTRRMIHVVCKMHAEFQNLTFWTLVVYGETSCKRLLQHPPGQSLVVIFI